MTISPAASSFIPAESLRKAVLTPAFYSPIRPAYLQRSILHDAGHR
jgi:hypothetical protein